MAKTVQQRIDEAVAEELRKYKERVRATALDVAETQGWCKSGVIETLSELDINTTSVVGGTIRLEFDFVVDEAGGYLTSAKEIEDALNNVRYYSHDIALVGEDDLLIVPNGNSINFKVLSVETENV